MFATELELAPPSLHLIRSLDLIISKSSNSWDIRERTLHGKNSYARCWGLGILGIWVIDPHSFEVIHKAIKFRFP